MIKILVALAIAAMLMIGCADYTGDTVNTNGSHNTDNGTDNSGNTNNTGGGETEKPDIDDSEFPAVPTYPAGANSIGQLDVNCKDDIIYYTLSYVCFKTTVKLATTANGVEVQEDEDTIQGSDPFVYYEQGHYERRGSTDSVTLIGTVSGGNPGGTYEKSCPSIK